MKSRDSLNINRPQSPGTSILDNRGVVPLNPLIPIDLIATTISDSQIDLTWTNVDTTGDGVSIERSINGVNYSEIDTVALGVNTYSDTGLDSYTLYYYRIRSFKGSL